MTLANISKTECLKGDILPTGLPPASSTGCEGSLSVHRDQELLQTITQDEELNRKLKFDEVSFGNPSFCTVMYLCQFLCQVRMEGCGCFSVHSGKSFGGRSFLVQVRLELSRRDKFANTLCCRLQAPTITEMLASKRS